MLPRSVVNILFSHRMACGQHIVFSYDGMCSTYCFLMHICLMSQVLAALSRIVCIGLTLFHAFSAESVSCYINFEESGQLG
jgi:hypothetical protein